MPSISDLFIDIALISIDCCSSVCPKLNLKTEHFLICKSTISYIFEICIVRVNSCFTNISFNFLPNDNIRPSPNWKHPQTTNHVAQMRKTVSDSIGNIV